MDFFAEFFRPGVVEGQDEVPAQGFAADLGGVDVHCTTPLSWRFSIRSATESSLASMTVWFLVVVVAHHVGHVQVGLPFEEFTLDADPVLGSRFKAGKALIPMVGSRFAGDLLAA